MGTVSHKMQLAQQQLLQSNTKQLEPHKGKVTSYLMVPMQKIIFILHLHLSSWCLQGQNEKSESMRNDF